MIVETHSPEIRALAMHEMALRSIVRRDRSPTLSSHERACSALKSKYGYTKDQIKNLMDARP